MKEILIIDNEKDLVKLTAITLKRWGYKPIKAFSGKEAFEILNKKIPDLIIVDLLMPETSGYDICREIKSDIKFNKVPIIISSAFVRGDIKKILKETSADDIITKPFDNDELKKKIATAIF